MIRVVAAMSRVLVVYGTTDGHTQKVADRIAKAIQEQGSSVDLINAKEISPTRVPERYDAVIVAASVHVGGYQPAVKRWVHLHATTLNGMRSAFVSVCLGVLESNPQAKAKLEDILQVFGTNTGWRPATTQLVAGAIPYTRYGFFKKWIMKRIARKAGGGTDTSRDYDYTDWVALERFAYDFGKNIIPIKLGA